MKTDGFKNLWLCLIRFNPFSSEPQLLTFGHAGCGGNSNYNGVMRTSKSTARKTAGSRNGSGREGLRAARIWIPDLDANSFRVEAHRQSAAVAMSAGEREEQNCVDAISDRVSEAE